MSYCLSWIPINVDVASLESSRTFPKLEKTKGRRVSQLLNTLSPSNYTVLGTYLNTAEGELTMHYSLDTTTGTE